MFEKCEQKTKLGQSW